MPKPLDPFAQRRFALDVVRRLRAAGYQALWAGGCVRDELLGAVPKDYDVATNARPEEIRTVFGNKRTIPLGAAFGVITVLGPPAAGTIEVATFRQDAAYSDGRHPDSVEFSDAAHDAMRRDFTVNGMFYDPVAEEVIDYVQGRIDLAQKRLRAIGNPWERFQEDRLRMLRAVRFATTLGFSLDHETAEAVRGMRHQITSVSAERIAQEMHRLLTHAQSAAGLQLLAQVQLLEMVLPEICGLAQIPPGDNPAASPAGGSLAEASWPLLLHLQERLQAPSFALALAALFGGQFKSSDIALATDRGQAVCQRWRLSNDISNRVTWLIEHQQALTGARSQAWSRLQPLLVHEGILELISLHEAQLLARNHRTDEIDYLRELLELPEEQLRPRPLVNGGDLLNLGVRRGPAFGKLLRQVRDLQLDGKLLNKEAALEFVRQNMPVE